MREKRICQKYPFTIMTNAYRCTAMCMFTHSGEGHPWKFLYHIIEIWRNIRSSEPENWTVKSDNKNSMVRKFNGQDSM